VRLHSIMVLNQLAGVQTRERRLGHARFGEGQRATNQAKYNMNGMRSSLTKSHHPEVPAEVATRLTLG